MIISEIDSALLPFSALPCVRTGVFDMGTNPRSMPATVSDAEQVLLETPDGKLLEHYLQTTFNSGSEIRICIRTVSSNVSMVFSMIIQSGIF